MEMVLLNPCNRLKFAPNMPLLPDLYYRSTVYDSFIGSVRSSSVHHGLIEIQQQQQGHFFRFFKIGAILPIYIHNSLSLSLSVQYTEQNQAILLHELHRMHVLSSRFYKVLQISLRPNICYYMYIF